MTLASGPLISTSIKSGSNVNFRATILFLGHEKLKLKATVKDVSAAWIKYYNGFIRIAFFIFFVAKERCGTKK